MLQKYDTEVKYCILIAFLLHKQGATPVNIGFLLDFIRMKNNFDKTEKRVQILLYHR
jgi:hypothetical protein